jgi:hypothetical protein
MAALRAVIEITDRLMLHRRLRIVLSRKTNIGQLSIGQASNLSLIEDLSKQRKVQVEDMSQGYRGKFTETVAQITCSAQESAFSFVCGPPEGSGTVLAQYGRELNEVFFDEAFPS